MTKTKESHFTVKFPVDDQFDALWRFMHEKPRGYTIDKSVIEEVTGFRYGTYECRKVIRLVGQRMLDERHIAFQYRHDTKVWKLLTEDEQRREAEKHVDKANSQEQHAIRKASVIDQDYLTEDARKRLNLLISQTARSLQQKEIDRKERKSLLSRPEGMPKRIR